MGIRHFFVIDNASTDGSGDFLARQPDVHLFHTDLSYKGSSAGRLWMQELCEHYGRNRWCLTVDVDELLVFPGAELVSIPQLTTFLEVEGAKGLFTIFLDMYSDRPLNETIYKPGEPFLDVCPFFETESYLLKPGANPPFLSVFGGPRGKSFLYEQGGNMGPIMKKVPLVKWEPGFSYIFSTHSHSHVPLSAVTGALLHFKFFDFFTDLAAYEAKRGDRRQSRDYAHYAKTMKDDVCFFGPDSRRYRSSADLVELGVTVSTMDFRGFCLSAAREQGPARERDMRRLLKPQQIDHGAAEVSRPTLRALPMIWPFVNNHAPAEHFSDGVVARKFTNRRHFVDRAREMVRIMDMDDTGLLVRIPEAIVYRKNHPRLTLVCFREGRLALKKGLPDGGARLQVAEGSLESSVYRIEYDFAAMAGPGETELRDLALFLAADEAMPEDGYAGKPLKVYEHALGAPLLEVPLMALGDSTVPAGLQRVRMDGVIEQVNETVLTGWVRDLDAGTWTAPVAIYIDDRFVGTARPKNKRKNLGPPDEEGMVFQIKLPLQYFYEQGHSGMILTARPVGRNVELRRTPLPLTGGMTFRWHAKEKRWLEMPMEELRDEVAVDESHTLVSKRQPSMPVSTVLQRCASQSRRAVVTSRQILGRLAQAIRRRYRK